AAFPSLPHVFSLLGWLCPELPTVSLFQAPVSEASTHLGLLLSKASILEKWTSGSQGDFLASGAKTDF
ncbi:mCG141046, partial [Mus musculus]